VYAADVVPSAVAGSKESANPAKLFGTWIRLYLWDGNMVPVAFAQE